MAYRRLPNTDNARIRALRRAIEKCNTFEGKEIVGSDVTRLQSILRNFESAQSNYKAALAVQVDANKKMQHIIKNARLYISHFIQVMNLCVIRGEIKPEHKELYGLEPEDFTVPDMTSNDALYTWGERIIDGEQKRIALRGAPIYNPSIARVKVDYSMFKDAFISQKTYQTNTQRQLDLLSSQRDDVDIVLRDVWNSIEAHFENLPRTEMLEKCRDYGVVYYIRKRSKLEEVESDDY